MFAWINKQRQQWHKTSRIKADIRQAKKRSEQAIQFEVDSLFLAACYQHCTSVGRLEVLSYVTGLQVAENRFVLTHLVPLELAYQSVSGARADNDALIRVLAELDHWGSVWLAHVHSHPGTGPAATQSSSTDRRFVERLARGGIRVLGVIVARGFEDEGYVRFFCHQGATFSVKVRGNNVEPVLEQENVYRLSGVGNCDLPIPVPDAPASRRSLCL